MQQNPLEHDPLFDPFTPEKAYVGLPDGGLAVDALQTAANYQESMLPELSASLLQTGDKLLVEFEDETSSEYLITEIAASSLTFGTDSVISPMVKYTDQENNESALSGSSISPGGTMLTPGSIKSGHHLVSSTRNGQRVSPGTITSFTVLRKRGEEYAELSPNQLTQRQEQSPEYAAVQSKFLQLTEQLGTTGFDFDTKEYVGYARFSETTDTELVIAGRQGFGCGVIPQREIYTYDAGNGILRALRSIPSEGVMQMATMQISPSELAATDLGEKSWKDVYMFESSNLHRATDYAPLVTYTWQNPGQTSPDITVLAYGHGLDGFIQSSSSEGPSNMAVPAEVNISTGNSSTDVRVVNPQWWVDDNSYLAVVSKATQAAIEGNSIRCTIGQTEIVVPTQLDAELGAMESIINNVVKQKHKRRGSHILNLEDPNN